MSYSGAINDMPNDRELSGTPERVARKALFSFVRARVGRSRDSGVRSNEWLGGHAATLVLKRVGNNSRSLLGAQPSPDSKQLLDARRLPFGRRRAARRLTVELTRRREFTSSIAGPTMMRNTLPPLASNDLFGVPKG